VVPFCCLLVLVDSAAANTNETKTTWRHISTIVFAERAAFPLLPPLPFARGFFSPDVLSPHSQADGKREALPHRELGHVEVVLGHVHRRPPALLLSPSSPASAPAAAAASSGQVSCEEDLPGAFPVRLLARQEVEEGRLARAGGPLRRTGRRRWRARGGVGGAGDATQSSACFVWMWCVPYVCVQVFVSVRACRHSCGSSIALRGRWSNNRLCC